MISNIEAERAVLGAILIDPAVMDSVVGVVDPSDFYDPDHALIFQAMRELDLTGIPIDLLSVYERLRTIGALEKAGGELKIATLADGIATTVGVEHWAKVVREKAQLRRVIEQAGLVIEAATAGPENVEQFLDSVAVSFAHTADARAGDHFSDMPELLTTGIAALEAATKNKKLMTGVPSGIDGVDAKTLGFQKGELSIIAARPGMGKSAWALNIARHCTRGNDLIVAFFSLEMNRDSLLLRLLAAESRMDQTSLRTGFINAADWDSMLAASGRLSKTRIFVDDSSAVSMVEIKSRSRRLRTQLGRLDLVVVDYLQLIQPAERKGYRPREQEISEISRSLKAMAKDLQVPVICLSQLNRKVEERGGHPRLSDLRESGAIEQDADVCIFIYKEDAKKKDNALVVESDYVVEIEIAKNRNGPIGSVKSLFNRSMGRFENLDWKQNSPR